MSTTTYDLVVIGGGTGGYVAAVRASQLGFRVAIVEQDKLGGTCLHRGCIPSKSLLHTAEVLNTLSEAQTFGVKVDTVQLDLFGAMLRKQAVVDQLYKGVQFLMKKHHIDVYRGRGRVMGPSIFSPSAGAVSVEYEDKEPQVLSPRFTLIATGSSPVGLPGLPFDKRRVLSSDDALELTSLPKSIAIIGAGAIGVEWASMFADFGVQVTLIEQAPQLLPSEDTEVSRELGRVFRKRQIQTRLSTRVNSEKSRVDEQSVILALESGDVTEEIACEAVLVAIGRAPVVEDLGLDATEVLFDRRGIQVDAHYRTREPNIYAIGDVIPGLQLAHVAAHQGVRAVEHMAGEVTHALDERMVPRCTYCRPEVASVGITEQFARENGYNVKIGKFKFGANGKAVILGHTDGFVKFVVDEDTDDILGVHMVGPKVTDYISEAGLAMVLNAVPWEVSHTVHAHPTLPESIAEAALAVTGMAIHGA